jgi:hypothetical protein
LQPRCKIVFTERLAAFPVHHRVATAIQFQQLWMELNDITLGFFIPEKVVHQGTTERLFFSGPGDLYNPADEACDLFFELLMAWPAGSAA